MRSPTRRILFWIFIFAVIMTFFPQPRAGAVEPSMAEYTSYPIFLSQSVTPNILIILDNSGSMNEVAYGTQATTVTDRPYYCLIHESNVSATRDMVEERVDNGDNWTGSGDLDFARMDNYPPDMMCGVRFRNINIPKGTTITKAYIQFTANVSSSGSTNLKIIGHDVDDSWQYTSGTYGNHVAADNKDLSTRTQTDASVSWSVPTWYSGATSTRNRGVIEASDPYRTPNLKDIIQEIVNRDGWDSGNSLSIFFENASPGTGFRGAKETTSSSGPILYIEHEYCEQYYGYFDPNGRYSYASNRFYRDSNGPWSGNWLNWLTMRKIDVARKVLMGGLATSRTGGGNQTNFGESTGSNNRKYTKYFDNSGTGETPYTGNYKYTCDNGYFYVYTSGGSYVATFMIAVQKDVNNEPDDFYEGNLAGILQRVGDKAKWGNMWFYTGTGSNREGGFLSNRIGSNMTNMVTDIENTPATTWTPLAETYYVAMQYFKQEAVDTSLGYHGTATGSLNNTNDPFYRDSKFVECPKNFVLLITDGASTMDSRVPSQYKDYDNDGNDYTSCNEYNSYTTCNYDSRGTDFLDDVALYARTNDLRSDLEGDQTLILYAVYAFGSDQNARSLLQDAAKNGGFTDQNGNNRPDLDTEWDADANGVPDTYYEASDGYQLQEQLLAAITDILKRASSGTAVSVLATSSEGEGTLTQAYFKPSITTIVGTQTKDVTWAGYLHTLWVDGMGRTREDTPPKGSRPGLVLSHDKIVDFYFDSATGEASFLRYSVDENGEPVFNDANGNGEWDEGETYVYTVHTMDELNPLWEAGDLLQSVNPDNRTIKTFVDLDNDGAVDDGEFLDFTTANLSSIKPFLGVKSDTAWTYLGTTPDYRAGNLMKYVRGNATGYEGANDLRFRDIDGIPWRLADIVQSTPVTVGAPSSNYDLVYSDQQYMSYVVAHKNREQVVYVGSNGGMLHAFSLGKYVTEDDNDTEATEEVYFTTGDSGAGYGAELWTYIPQAVLPHLKWLADPDYTHVYYVDLKPRVVDAQIFTADDDHVNGWGTILLGGLNMGGKHIWAVDDFPEGNDSTRNFYSTHFAIDITVPYSPKLLWEKTYSNIGLTANVPTIAKLNDNWYGILTSGPTTYEGTSNQNGHVYVVDLKTGDLLRDLTGEDGDAFMAAPITVDYGLNYSTEAGYIGQTNYKANKWEGKMYRLMFPKTNGDWRTANANDQYDTNPENWTMTALADAGGPITAAPAASIDDFNNLWLYYGTGRYFSDDDKVDSTTQYFYGIKDPYFNSDQYDTQDAVAAVGSGDLDLLDTTNAVIYTDLSIDGMGAYGINDWRGLVSAMNNRDGWYMRLGVDAGDEGERIVTKPVVIGGIVLTTSFVPNSDPCGYSGHSNILACYYTTGTAFYVEVLTGTNKTDAETGKTEVSRKKNIGVGKASEVRIHVGKQQGATGYVQQSTGIVEDLSLNPPEALRSGMIYWRER